jgi:hypothetical protein
MPSAGKPRNAASYHADPSPLAYLAELLEPAVLAAARRIDDGEGFTVRESVAELERPVRWVLSEHTHRAANDAGGRARIRFYV